MPNQIGFTSDPSHADIPMLDLPAQYRRLKAEIDTAIQSVLESGNYILGKEVAGFEKNLAHLLGCKQVIGVASGSDALLLSLHALGIGPGDKVIVPAFTFFATAGAVSRLGAIPVFVDIDPATYNLDLNQVADLVQKDPAIKAIIPVHIFGLPVDMHHLMSLAESHNLYVIEDACQAINADMGTTGTDPASPGRKAGAIGNTGCFSFFPSKNLGGYGDGGAIATNDDELAERIRVLRVHGSQPKYYHRVVGYNSRLDSIQAAILNVKLKYLQEWTQKRRQVAMAYSEAFAAAGLREKIIWPQVSSGHVFHQYVIEVDKREELADYLKKAGISTAVYYPLPLHLQECFADLGYRAGDLPVAERACQRVLALPIDPELTKEQVVYIAQCIKNFCDLKGK